MKILLALAFLLCISVGYGLKCYQCMSAKSWNDCDSNKKEVDCMPGQDTCAKLYFDGKVGDVSLEGFGKSCGVKSACNKDACKAIAQTGATINKCDVNCCDDKNLCNGAKVPLVSAFLLLACALLAFFR